MTGVPLLAAVASPSSLVLSTAARCGMTLVGFLRDDSTYTANQDEFIDGRLWGCTCDEEPLVRVCAFSSTLDCPVQHSLFPHNAAR
jgi:hypothetical protein